MYKVTKYYTENCPSCKVLSAIMANYADVVEISEINCDDVPEAFLSKTSIMGVPTVVLTYNNNNTLREVARFMGPKTHRQFGEWLNESIEKDKAITNGN